MTKALPLLALALVAVACNGPVPTAGNGIKIDATDKISIDSSKVPDSTDLSSTCQSGEVLTYSEAGWTCRALPDTSVFATEAELADYAQKTDLTGYATQDDLAAAEASNADTYATKQQLSAYALTTDLAPFAKEDELSNYALKTDLAPLATQSALATTSDDLASLKAEVDALKSTVAAAVPTGTVIAYGAPIDDQHPAPDGWLVCDGSTVSRTQYAALFAAIGISAGGGDGVDTFNLPDYRGRFLRGVDAGSGHDPDAASRIAEATSGNVGDAVGSLEGDLLGSHAHGINDPGHSHGISDPGHSHPTGIPGPLVAWNGSTCSGNFGTITNSFGGACVDAVNPSTAYTGITIQGATTGITVQAAGGSETRPKNVGVNYLIKD